MALNPISASEASLWEWCGGGGCLSRRGTCRNAWDAKICLVGGLEPWNFMTFHSVGNFIIPTDEVIFFRGVGIPPTRCAFSFPFNICNTYNLYYDMHRLIDGKKISTTVWPVPALLLDMFNPMEKPWRSPGPPGPCLYWELQGTRLKVVGVINQLVACGPLVRCVSCTVTRPTMRDTGHVWRKMIWHSWDRESMFSGFVVSGEWVRPHAPGLLYTSQPLDDGWLLTWWCGWHAVGGNAITMTMTIVHNSEVFKINFCWEISYIIIIYI